MAIYVRNINKQELNAKKIPPDLYDSVSTVPLNSPNKSIDLTYHLHHLY